MEQELEQIEGTVEDIIYENTDNGYTVFEISGGGVLWRERISQMVFMRRRSAIMMVCFI